MKKPKTVIHWALSILFIVSGFSYFIAGKPAGIFLLLGGIALVPIIRQMLRINIRYEVIATFAFFVVVVVNTSVTSPGSITFEANIPHSGQPATDTIHHTAMVDETSPSSHSLRDDIEPAGSRPAVTEIPDAATPTGALDAVAEPTPAVSDDLSVHFIDVGQADSILIQLPNGQNMLIDGGGSAEAGIVLDYLKKYNITAIDYLVATHPHTDHIGGLPAIIGGTEIGSVFMPRVSHTTQAFEQLLTSISNKGLQIDTAKAGVSILSIPGLQVDILAPARDSYDELNNYSAVIKLAYGSISFLFMGDAEALSEEQITADISSDVLKVGHHGSNTSTTDAFLKRVGPGYAVISVGAGNLYGLPADEVLSRLYETGVSVYRTDHHGTVVITSDGEHIAVRTEPAPSQQQAPPSASVEGSGGVSLDSSRSGNSMGTGAGSTESSTAGGSDTGSGTESSSAIGTGGAGSSSGGSRTATDGSMSISGSGSTANGNATLENAKPNEVTVYITHTGNSYHLGGCRHLAKSKIASTLSAAKAKGLTACGTCKPSY